MESEKRLLLYFRENMRIILFLFHYLSLRLSVLFGLHLTANPLNLQWRWRQWNHNYLAQLRRMSKIQDKRLNKIDPHIIQLAPGKSLTSREFKAWMAEVAAIAIHNLEEMHKLDVLRREQLRKF